MDIRNFFGPSANTKKLSRSKNGAGKDSTSSTEVKPSPSKKARSPGKPDDAPPKKKQKSSTDEEVSLDKKQKPSRIVELEKSNSSKSKKTSPAKDPPKAMSPIKPIVTEPLNAEPSSLLVDKYKPTTLKGIIGQQGDKSNMKKLMNWIQNWSKHHCTGSKAPPRPPPWNAGADNGAWARAALLSGPPGVGKTTTAHLVSKELGYDVMELNASDTRSKKLLEQSMSDAMTSTSLSKASKKRILLMDEVDGMAGNEDRGGMAELIQLIKKSKIPVICMCNDRNHQKIRSLANYCFDLRFQRPRVDQIKGSMMSVCFKEKIKIAPDALNELIVSCNQDVRQVLHHLSMIKVRKSDTKYELDQAKKDSESSKKTSIKVGPFDVVRKVFSAYEHKEMSLFDKSDLFFQDYSFGPLFNQENYLNVEPKAAKNDRQVLELISQAASSFCLGDIVERTIRSQNSWNLLPVQAMYSSVIPGEYMAGTMHGQIQFPSWLGKFSKQNKNDRILQEIQSHMRLSSGLSKRALNEDVRCHLRDAIVRPLALRGNDGVKESVEVMKQYALQREDLDNLIDICQWGSEESPLKFVDSKVKAAFTRLYNKEIVLPYSTGAVTAKRKVAVPSGTEGIEGEDEEVESEDDNEDISKDTMIKAKKPSKPKAKAAEKEPATRGGKGGGGGRGGKRSKK